MAINEEPTEKPKASKKDFTEWYKSNPGVDNVDIYAQFPNNPQGTLRRWKMEERPAPSPPSLPPTPPSKSDETLSQNNEALMRGTSFTPKDFEGMTAKATNRFLLNFKAKQGSKPSSPNTPIVGTPVGSGNPKMKIDDYVSMNASRKEINFDAPASLVLKKHKNKEQAEKYWML